MIAKSNIRLLCRDYSACTSHHPGGQTSVQLPQPLRYHIGRLPLVTLGYGIVVWCYWVRGCGQIHHCLLWSELQWTSQVL